MAPTVLLFVCLITVCAAVPSDKVRMKLDARPFGEHAPASAHAIAPCTKGGAACDPTCRKTGLCIQSGDGFVFRETADCGSLCCKNDGVTATCGSCDSTHCLTEPMENFRCDSTGVFPDLYDCHNVLLCVEGQLAQSTRICEDDLAYDACTGYCGMAPANKTCYPQTNICQYAGQFGRVQYNHRLYYYCVQDVQAPLYPVIGRCEKGFFDLPSVSCTVSDEMGCVAPE